MPPYTSPNNQRLARWLLAFIVLFLFILILFSVIKSLPFHIVSTNPNTSSVATTSPFLKINFNKELEPGSITLTSSYGSAKSYTVHGKTMTIVLDTPLTAGYTYNITLVHIIDTKGSVLKNKVLSFVPTNVPFESLPSDQQQYILKGQTVHPPSPATINFQNTTALLNDGLSSLQINNLERGFFQYAPKAKTIVIVQGSVEPGPHNPNANSGFSINFKVSIDGSNYNATVTYTDSISIRLYLYNIQTGAQIFDSGSAGTGG